jgi:hypothetical protein
VGRLDSLSNKKRAVRCWISEFAEYYRSFVTTTTHTVLASIALPIGLFFAGTFPPLIIPVIGGYVVFVLAAFYRSNPTTIEVECIPTKVEAGNRMPDTEARRNNEIRFANDETTVFTSIEVDRDRTGFRLRFDTPTPPVQAELRGRPVPEQQYDPMANMLTCDDMSVYQFDPVIDLYLVDDASLSGGDYYLRIYDDETDDLLTEYRLVQA